MRKLIFTFLIFLTLSLNAQDYTVRFLGIPVDGTEKEMISKLKKKGFKYHNYSDERNHGYLEGRFNNDDVILFIHTNSNTNQVWRIAVLDKDIVSNEASIRIRFNKLMDQFEGNEKYSSLFYDNKKIEEGEDISYEMNVNNKSYRAYFTQGYSIEETRALYNNNNYFKKWLSHKFNEQELDSLYNISKDKNEFEEKIRNSFFFNHNAMFLYGNNLVWYTIYELNGKYAILFYYENIKNEPNGEDL